MNKLITENSKIESMIYEVRGKQVMLDKDLAKLYQCANGTKSLNLAVKRHKNRFPERYMFQLNKEEASRFQIETLNSRGTNIKYLPYVFTEEGVAMLATILKTNIAEEISIKIMDAFVSMRKYISANLLEQKYINNQVMKNTENIRLLQQSFSKLEEKRKVNEIYFNGQIFDAYSKIVDIMSEAKEELIIVDGYADKTVLDMIKNLKCKVILITKRNALLKPLDVEKYNSQYTNLQIIYSNTFHDRYFILDRKVVYHCGASLNHAGSKTFSINILEDEVLKKSLITNVENLFS